MTVRSSKTFNPLPLAAMVVVLWAAILAPFFL